MGYKIFQKNYIEHSFKNEQNIQQNLKQ